jgi:hypothetical protein
MGIGQCFFFQFFYFAKLDEILLKKPFIVAEKHGFPGLFFLNENWLQKKVICTQYSFFLIL